MKTFIFWIQAARPATLWASIAPVMLGTAMAYGDGLHHFPSAIVALAAAVFIQVGTNLANDYFDAQNGVDTPDRKGPARVTANGLIPPWAVRWGFIFCFVLAALISSYLLARAGWPVLIIGILSIFSGYFYAAGPRPLSHLGLGELFVLVFFGPVAVAGTYFVQSFECNPAVLLAGLLPGFFSTAILAINNLRDINTDQKAGKKTLAVRWGRRFAQNEIVFCILAAMLIPSLIYWLIDMKPLILGASAASLFLIPVIHTIHTKDTDGPAMNSALAATGKILFLQTFLFSLAWIL